MRTRVSPSLSIPPMSPIPYIFIISCIRRLSSESVIMDATFLFLSFSSLIAILSFFIAFLNTLLIFSVAASISSCSFLLVLPLKVSVTSASILMNLMPSFLASSCEMNGWSMLWFRITASILAFLNISMYWLCCFSSVT